MVYNNVIYVILICIIILYYTYYKYNNSVKIIFYTSDQLSKKIYYILYDYYYYMSDENLKLRGIDNVSEYLKNINKLFYTCSYYESKLIKRAVHKANKRINNLNYAGFYPYKLKDIPWTFGFSNSNDYEFGFPQTQGQIIILNKNNIHMSDLVTLLIHERIHIYQKLYPNDVDEFIDYYNFQKVSKKTNTDRANPDTNNFLYKRFNEIYECKIVKDDSDNHKAACAKNDSMYEHPYEYMAYMISETV